MAQNRFLNPLKAVLLLIILSFIPHLSGQSVNSLSEKQIKEDSLLNLLKESQTDSVRMVLYDQLRRITIFENPEKALEYTRELGKHALLAGKDRMHAVSLIYEGNAYTALGRFNEALEKFLEGEKYFDTHKDSTALTSVYNALGAIYEGTERDSLAIIYFDKSYQLAVLRNDLTRQIYSLNNLSNIHYRKGDYINSEIMLEKVMQIPEQSFPLNFYNMAKVNYANTLKMVDKMAESEKLYREVLKEEDMLDNFTRCMAKKGIGSIHLLQKKPQSAIAFLHDALMLARTNNFKPEEKEILKDLTLSYEALGNYRLAYSYMKEHTSLKDSLLSDEKDKNLIDALTRFESQKKEQEIALLTANNELKDLKIKQSSTVFWFLLTVLFGVISVLLLAIRAQRVKMRANRQLQDKNRQISHALEEKNILLREIHHRVKNNLQVISSLLKLQSHYIEDESAVKAIAEGRNRVHSMALLHQNLYRDDNLTGVDMKDYFTHLIEGLFEAYNIHSEEVKLQSNIEDLYLDIDTVIPLGLIANELISNALKHAFKEKKDALLTVTLKEENGKLIFKVEDNGIGIDLIASKEKKSFGQKLIQSLAEKLEAEIQIETSEGTSVQLIIRDYQKAA